MCTQVKYNDGYATDDDASQVSVRSETPLDLQRSAPPQAQPTVTRHQVPGTTTPGSASSSRYVVNLGHQPGESDVGYENVAFTRGSGSIEGSVHFVGNPNF